MTFITNNLFFYNHWCLGEPGDHCTTLYIPNQPLVIEIVCVCCLSGSIQVETLSCCQPPTLAQLIRLLPCAQTSAASAPPFFLFLFLFFFLTCEFFIQLFFFLTPMCTSLQRIPFPNTTHRTCSTMTELLEILMFVCAAPMGINQQITISTIRGAETDATFFL